jgi:hypothetical protein
MSTKLNIQINSIGRNFLRDNNEKIILVFSSDKESKFSIACVSFEPFGDSNEVEFFNDFLLYGTPQDILSFEIIKFTEKLAIQYDDVYKFDGVKFTYLREAYSNYVVGLSNESANKNNLTSGIAQRINVLNSEEVPPIIIGSVPQNQTIYFDKTHLVRIFVARGISSNMIIPNRILTPVKRESMKKINKNKNSQLLVGDYLEIDLRETTRVEFDIAIRAFKK